MLGTLCNKMKSRYQKHKMIGLNLLPTHQKGSLPSTNWTIQANGVAYPTAPYLCLGQNETNTNLIVSQMDTIQLLQMKTTVQFLHMEGEFFYQGCNKGEYEDDVREKTSEYDPPPWVDVEENPFSISRKVCLNDKITEKLGITKCVMRERYLLFLSASVPAV